MKSLFIPGLLFTILVSFSAIVSIHAQDSISSPDEYFGFKPGTDRELINYDGLISYLDMLDQASDMVKITEIGHSPMGKPMYIAFVSNEDNIARLDELREINRRLALDPDIPDNEREQLISDARVFVMATHSLHSSEVGPANAVPLIAHDLITSADPDIKEIMDKVVFMIIPNPNPDGMDMVYDNYVKNKGTKYEGASLPSVYHKYVGHDNNRDFVNLTQDDTKAISKITSLDWFPQVYIDKHQMGSTGIRYFVPPLHDPIAEVVDGELWSWTGIFGYNMLKDMTMNGNKGVGTNTMFDLYWPGASLTCIWKNVIGMLTEAASVKYATPIFVEPTEISVWGKGLSEYKKGVNLPDPWEGGWWRLGDIIDYEISSTMSVLKTAAYRRDAILEFRNDICRKEVNKGLTIAPHYYVLPKTQTDISEFVNLVNLLREHGIMVFELQDTFILSGEHLSPGDIVIPLAQPFRPFIKEVMEPQEFPVRRYTPGGEIITPYDITSWSLPLHRNVRCLGLNELSNDFENKLEILDKDYSLNEGIPEDAETLIYSSASNGSYKAAFIAMKNGIKVERTTGDIDAHGNVIPAGSFIVKVNNRSRKHMNELAAEQGFSPIALHDGATLSGIPAELPRIALIQVYFSDMDAGWTRYILDSYGIPFTKIHPGDIKDVNLDKDFDVVIIPDASKELLLSGKTRPDGSRLLGSAHPEHIKGMGAEGLKKLTAFINSGGKLIAWGDACELFQGKLSLNDEEFHLPFNVDKRPYSNGVNIPGSLLKAEVLEDHPLTMGMPAECGVYFSNSPVFTTTVPGFDVDRRVIVRFPEKDLLLSGYAEKEEEIGNKSAMLWLRKGKGQLVLFGFGPQFRASTQSTYKLFFNAILLPDM